MLTSEALRVLTGVLAPYVGDTMARSATEAHCRKLGIVGDAIGPEELESLLTRLGRGLNIFLGRDKSEAVMNEARRALGQVSA